MSNRDWAKGQRVSFRPLVLAILGAIAVAFLAGVFAGKALSSEGSAIEHVAEPSEVRGGGAVSPTAVGDNSETQAVAALPRTLKVHPSDPTTKGSMLEPVIAPVEVKPSVESQLRLAANHFGINPDHFVAVAWCESKFDPQAVGDHGASVGVMQFKEATFRANSIRYFGYSIGDARRDVMASAVVAGYMWKIGQSRQWTCARTLGFA